jgi:hypothetical protein
LAICLVDGLGCSSRGTRDVCRFFYTEMKIVPNQSAHGTR